MTENEEHLLAQINSSSDRIWSIDKNMNITIVNEIMSRNYEQAFGVKLKAGMSIMEGVPEPLADVWRGRYKRALTGEQFSEVDNFDIQGIPEFIQVSFNPIVKNNVVIGVACFSRDISKLKKVELELKNSEANLIAQIENSKNSILSVDSKYRLILANTAFKTTFDAAFNCSIEPGSNLIDLLPEPFKNQWKDRYDRSLAGESFSVVDELNFGEPIYLEVSFYPITVEGKIVGVSCFASDITKLKISEKQLLEANATKDRFFSILAHDLKGPLGNIRSLTKLLKDGDAADEQELMISIIEKSAISTYSLLENLLTWSLSQTGALEVRPTKVVLRENVEQALKSVRELAAEKEISLENNIENGLAAMADKNMISLIIRNLVSNGIKFTNPGGFVKVEAQQNANQIELFVTDNGIGMDQTIIDSLYLLGEKHSRRGTAKETGTGLGMVITKEFVEKNNGTLAVESNVNGGTKFTVKLAAVAN